MVSEDISGRTVSHYQILKRLGAGGMGVVYLAQDTRLERVLAIKILPPEVAADQERMKRFVREAKAASAIDHPNIIHVYDIGQEDDIHFIAMQFVEGETLGSKIKRKALTLDELMPLSIQIVDAISEAHRRGIIHRDLKPANIMISSNGLVKLLDFGLARIESTEPKDGIEMETLSRTEIGTVLGTVAYMSPEQALGKQIDHRTDIFSIGIVLYEMATGRLPFSGKTATETIDKIIHAEPESVIHLNGNIPPQLELIIRKCMEKFPEARYQSAAEILIDLKNLKRDSESSTSRDRTKTSSSSSRNRWIVPLVLVCVVALAGLAYRYWPGNTGQIHALAVLPFKNVNLDPKTEYLSDGITDSIINNVSLIRQIRVMARGTVFTYKNKEVDPRQVGKELEVDGVVTGKLLQEGDSLLVTVDFVDARDGRQIWGEQYDRKLTDVLALQSEISKAISDKLRVNLTGQEQSLVTKQYTKNTEAYQFYLQGQYFLNQRTPDTTQKARNYFRQALEKDPSYALAYDGLAGSYLYLGISGALLGGLPPKEVMPRAKEYALDRKSVV